MHITPRQKNTTFHQEIAQTCSVLPSLRLFRGLVHSNVSKTFLEAQQTIGIDSCGLEIEAPFIAPGQYETHPPVDACLHKAPTREQQLRSRQLGRHKYTHRNPQSSTGGDTPAGTHRGGVESPLYSLCESFQSTGWAVAVLRATCYLKKVFAERSIFEPWASIFHPTLSPSRRTHIHPATLTSVKPVSAVAATTTAAYETSIHTSRYTHLILL